MIPIPIAQMARDRGRRKSTRLRPIIPTRALADDLFAIYADSLRVWADLAAALARDYTQPAPIRTDADGMQLQWLVDQAARKADETLIYQTEKLGRWVSRVGEWHGRKTISSVQSALGVDITPYMRLSDIREPLDASIRENVSLIRAINADTRAKMEAIMFDAIANRRTKKHVTDAIAAAMGITKKRARRIANDQLHRLSIALTAIRNQQMGIETYIWQTREDDRVRRVHRERNHKVFRWDTPPFDGAPGMPINCRCLSVPIVDI